MKIEQWKSLPTWLKKISLMDAYNMSEVEAIAKLKSWGDWKESEAKPK